ncbi:MAG: hypothetical protein JXA09_01315 [Anaerolineae bacterium]|nr:hypothetical protein [Anaerolineae bacterium]
MKKRWALLLAMALLVTPVVSVAADDAAPGLEMQVAAAFGGHFKYGEWLPIWVQLGNSGPDREIEVHVRVTGSWGETTYGAAVSLPSGARKRVPVYVMPNNYSRALAVQIVEGGAVVSEARVDVHPHYNAEYLVGLVAPQRGALALIPSATLAGVERAITLVDLSLDHMPDRAEGLRSLDSLVINDVDTSSLSAGQKAALEGWVRQGGHLVLGGGAGAQRTTQGIPEALWSTRTQALLEVDELPGLEAYAGGVPVRVAGPFVVADLETEDGRAGAAQGQVTLVHGRQVGAGRVNVVALDLAGAPFDAWAGTLPLWGRLLLSSAAYPVGLPQDMSPRQMVSSQMNYALSALPALALPSAQWLAVLLGAYVFLVGPANYVFLRWRGKLQWAWLTIPAITLVFSGGAFALGYLLRGTDLILNKVAVATMQPDGTALVRTYLGLFSPSQQSYEITVEGSGLLSPLEQEGQPFSGAAAGVPAKTVFLQGRPAQVRGLAVNQWSMQTFVSEDVWQDAGGIAADLTVDGDALVGAVRNETSLLLEDVVLILGTSFVRLGDLQPGATADVSLPIGGANGGPMGAPLSYRLFEDAFNEPGPNGIAREVQFKQIVLDSVFETGGKFGILSSGSGLRNVSGGSAQLYVVGWFDEAPPLVRVGERRPAEQTMGLLYAPLTYRLGTEGGLAIPPGLIGGVLSQYPQEGGPCGPGDGAAVYIGRGAAVFDFALPAEVGGDVQTIVVQIGSDGGWGGAPGLALYDWDAAQWVEVDDPVLGRNIVQGSRGFVSEDGLVRVQLASTGVESGCYYVDLGVEGEQ